MFKLKKIVKEQPVSEKGINKEEIIPITLELAETSKAIFNASKEIVNQSVHLSTRAQGVAEFVGVSKEHIAIVDRDMQNIATHVAAIQNESAKNKDLSMESKGYVSQGKECMKDAIDKIGELENTYKEVLHKLEELETYAKGITKITHYMEEIASKTSILSINASIEAARAGEAGRGFNVITGEIKNLAEQSQGFSNEIDEMVNHITCCLKGIEETSKANYEEIIETKQTVTDVGEILTKIVDCTEQLDQHIEQTMVNSVKINEGTIKGKEKVDLLKASFVKMSENVYEVIDGIEKQEKIAYQFKGIGEESVDISDRQIEIVLDEEVENKMRDIGQVITAYTGSQTQSALLQLAKECHVSAIYYIDEQGNFSHSSENDAIGFNIFEVNPQFKRFAESDERIKIFPVARNYSTGELAKYMSVKQSKNNRPISIRFDLKDLIKLK